MSDEAPFHARCERCNLITKPTIQQVRDGYECPACGHNHFATHRETPVCDFCCHRGLPVAYAYPARDFGVPLPGVAMSANSRGWWAACQPCHRLITKGDRERLAQRSAKVYRRQEDTDLSLTHLATAVRELHDMFWQHRDGPPIEEINA